LLLERVDRTAPRGGSGARRVEPPKPPGESLWQDGGVPFPYYQRLSARRQKIYRRSDAIGEVEIPEAQGLRPLVEELKTALEAEDRRAVERASQSLALGICERLGVPRIGVKVLAARPSGNWGELHGLYDPEKVPPLRSFLRTLVHELLHHLDYEYFHLEETFHTEGFFRRESSVARQLLGEPATAAPPEGGRGRSPARRRSASGTGRV